MVKLTVNQKQILNDIKNNNKQFKFKQKNPKKGKNTKIRYEIYKSATNYSEFLQLGGDSGEFLNDFKKGFIIIDNIDNILPDSNSEHSITTEIVDVEDIIETDEQIIKKLIKDLIEEVCPPELNIQEIINNYKKEISIKIENIKVENTYKRLKTPLRYAGGKSKAIYILEKHLPKDMNKITEFHDCFLGGGSFPIYLSKIYPNLKIKVNDVYKPLYNFWIHLRDNGIELSDKLLKIKQENNTEEKAKIIFIKAQEKLKKDEEYDIEHAVAFYIINKCGFSGLVSSSFSAQASVSNFGISGIENLKTYHKIIQGWEIYNLDYKEFVEKYSNKKEVLIYMDPPYMIKDNLYGDGGDLHKIFKHEEFFKVCHQLEANQLISYNSDKLIKNAFIGYEMSDYDLTYTMRSTGNYMEQQKERKELVMKHYLN
jgi:site-specific DNA-adenine methylase